jgi:hypothetical protein
MNAFSLRLILRILLGLAFAVIAGCARPVAIAPPRAAAPPPREVLVIRYANRELAFPNVFEPHGEHVGVLEGSSCDIWQRDGRFLGTAPEETCAGWLRRGVRATSPDGRFEETKGDDGGGVRVLESATRRVVWQSGDDDECDADHFAWSLAEPSFVVHCGGAVVARSLPDGRLIGWTSLPKDDSFSEMVWEDRVYVVLAGKDDGPKLFSWIPGHAETSVEDDRPMSIEIVLDPATGAVWKHSAFCGHACADTMTVTGGVGTPTSYSTYHSQYDEGRSTKVIADDGGSAFVVDESEDGHDGTGHTLFLVRLSVSGGFLRDQIFTDCCDSTVLAAVARGGAWSALVVRSTRFVENNLEIRVIVVDPSGTPIWELRNAPELLAAFENEDIRDIELSGEDHALSVRGRSAKVAVTLGGAVVARSTTRSGSVNVSPREIPDRFGFDGDLLTRADGLALSTRNPCWWPDEWKDERPSDSLFRVGEDPLTAREVGAEVRAVFCAPGLLDRFVRGEPMPPRPRPVLRLAQ